jgi:hypothetical protein
MNLPLLAWNLGRVAIAFDVISGVLLLGKHCAGSEESEAEFHGSLRTIQLYPSHEAS